MMLTYGAYLKEVRQLIVSVELSASITANILELPGGLIKRNGGAIGMKHADIRAQKGAARRDSI